MDEIFGYENHNIDRRSLITGSFALAAGLALGGGMLMEPANATTKKPKKKPKKVSMTSMSMQLGWLFDNGQLGEAVAYGKGWYKSNGINFSIRPGGPSIDGVTLVASGRSTVGQVSSSPSLMLARSEGVPIKAFAAGIQEHPYAFFSLPNKPVHTPMDLIGKKIGTQATGVILVKALLAKNHIDPKDVEIVTVGSDVTPLTSGQVDVWTGWISNVAALRPLGPDKVVMRLWDTGIQLYANVYYTNDNALKNDSVRLTKFLEATSAGWDYARKNPDAAIDFLVRMSPTLDRVAMKEQAAVLLPMGYNAATKKDGWGTMSATLWQNQLNMWQSLNQFSALGSGKPEVSEVMTTSILKASAAKRAKV